MNLSFTNINLNLKLIVRVAGFSFLFLNIFLLGGCAGISGCDNRGVLRQTGVGNGDIRADVPGRRRSLRTGRALRVFRS